MRNKYILGCILLGGFLVVGFLFFLSSHSTKATSTLSQRSKEYLQNRNEKSGSSLQYATVGETADEDNKNNTFIVGHCFSLRVSFRVSSHRLEGECFISIALRSPRGTIISYKKKEPISALDQIPGVPMRRLYRDQYEEKHISLSGKEFVVFSKKDQYFEKSAFLMLDDGYIVVNALLQSGEKNEELFEQMLSSVMLK